MTIKANIRKDFPIALRKRFTETDSQTEAYSQDPHKQLRRRALKQ